MTSVILLIPTFPRLLSMVYPMSEKAFAEVITQSFIKTFDPLPCVESVVEPFGSSAFERPPRLESAKRVCR